MKKSALVLLSSTLSVLSMISINYLLTTRIYDSEVLPDPCDYHMKEDIKTSFLFDLFFPSTESNGCHPGPHLFFYFFVLATGSAIGILISKFIIRLFWKK